MTLLKKTASFVLAAAMLAGCGSAASTASTAASTTSAAAASSGSGNILTIATTNQLSTLNPLQMNWNFVDMYATSLEFLPLAVLDDNYEFTPMLVESITTDDNLTFHVKVADNAAWSDGEPVTSDDIIWTILKMTSPAVANTHFDFSMIKGLESGLSEEGADSVEGLVKVDDKDLDIVLNRPMALSTFLNNLATWILILPKHALEDIPDDQLVGNAWFNAPTVVSGPYMATEEDLAHYVTYKVNENYFLGASKIETVNLQVYDGSSVLAALQTGDVQFVHPAICDIPYQERDAVENLDGFAVTYAKPITNEMTFFNCHNLPDVNLRKAIVEAIDRDTIVSSLLPNNGQRGDGWIPQADTTFYDASAMETIPYDPEDAKALLAKGITPIICVGESLEQREMDLTMEYVAYQVKAALSGIDASALRHCVIAYEPIWAIGTGRTATPEQAEEVCELIRSIIRKKYGSKISRATTILYGGSMNDKNAEELLAQPDIDGGLIGGASLVPEKFLKIIEAANQDA